MSREREVEGVGDTVAESLRSLASLPASLLPALVERYLESRDELVLLGLLLAHPARAEYAERVFAFLEETRLHGICRYLVSALTAERNANTIRRLERMARRERDPAKKRILDDALSLRYEMHGLCSNGRRIPLLDPAEPSPPVILSVAKNLNSVGEA